MWEWEFEGNEIFFNDIIKKYLWMYVSYAFYVHV